MPTEEFKMRRGGFTLIELMVVVSVIGTLATIAIPGYQRMQLRSRTSEALTNLGGIRTTQAAYFAESATYVGVAGPNPPAVPGTAPVAWPAGSNFDVLGWAPEGVVRFQYAMTGDAAGAPGAAILRYTAEATSDVDGDGTPAFFGLIVPQSGAVAGLAGPIAGSTCVATGVYNAGTGAQDVINVPGACTQFDGRSIF